MKDLNKLIACLFLFVLAAAMLSGSLLPSGVKYVAGAAGFLLFILSVFWDKQKKPEVLYPEIQDSGSFLLSMPLAFVSCTKAGFITGFNDAFNLLFHLVQKGHSVTDYLPVANIKQKKIKIADVPYRIVSWFGEEDYFVLVKTEISECPLPVEYDAATNIAAVGTIFIDNYDEVLDTLEEARHSILTALIDRKLNTLFIEIGGIIKKFEKDRYIFVVSKEGLDILKERKFDVLEEMKEINMGNKLPVTLSIGIGVHGENLAQNMEFSRNALDLALGRGGDQALIKENEKYHFYGGKTKGVERNSNVRARVKAYALLELIKEAPDIYIMGHDNPDMDCFGSAIGVFRMADSCGKRPFIILDAVPPNIKRMYDRLVDLDSYHKTRFLSSAIALEKMDEQSLLIVVDTHRPSYCQCQEALEKTNKIVLIDHHRKSTEFIENTVLVYHEPYASSASELVTEMLQYVDAPLDMKDVEADCLLAGIMVDTKNFTIKTGAKTFETAAYLRRNNADTVRIRMALQNDMGSYLAKASAVTDSELFMETIAISKCTEASSNPSVTAAQAADELLNIEGIQASFVLAQVEDRILVSARSLGEINVQRIMEKIGGGGHQTVSGAQLPTLDYDAAIQKVKEAILDYLKEVNA